MDRKEVIVVVQAEATSAGANTVGIVEIRSLEDNRSLKFVSSGSPCQKQRNKEEKIVMWVWYSGTRCLLILVIVVSRNRVL